MNTKSAATAFAGSFAAAMTLIAATATAGPVAAQPGSESKRVRKSDVASQRQDLRGNAQSAGALGDERLIAEEQDAVSAPLQAGQEPGGRALGATPDASSVVGGHVHRRAGALAQAAKKARMDDTTYSFCSPVSSGKTGNERTTRAACSETGKSPSPYPR